MIKKTICKNVKDGIKNSIQQTAKTVFRLYVLCL